MPEYTLAEIEEEEQRRLREGSPVVDASTAERAKTLAGNTLEGASSGATGIMSLPFEAAAFVGNLPVYAEDKIREAVGAEPLPEKRGFSSPSSIVREMFGIPEAPKGGIGKFLYNFAEGAVPSAAVGAVGGPLTALGAGVVGGLSNVGVKELAGDNPWAQAAYNTALSLVPGAKGWMRQRKPTGPGTAGPIVDPETGAHLSPGQASGEVSQLAREEGMRRGITTADDVKNFDIAQTRLAEKNLDTAQSAAREAIVDPQQLTGTVHSAYQKARVKLVDTFKETNQKLFRRANEIGGGQETIPTDNVRATVQSLLDGIPEEAPNFSSIKNAIKKIDAEYNPEVPGGKIIDQKGVALIPKSKGTKKISVEDMQTNLSAWSDAAKNGQYILRDGTNAFGDVAPGQVKGMARRVLWGFKKDLDAAIQLDVPGAAALKEARTKFVDGLRKIEEFSGQPLVKHFEENFATGLEPESTVNKLATLPPSQQRMLANILKDDYPAAWEGVRMHSFEKLRSKMTNEDGSFNTERARATMKSLNDHEFDYLFPTDAEKNRAKASMGLLEHIERKRGTASLSEVELKDAVRAASDAAGAWTGFTGKYLVITAADIVKAVLGGGNAAKARTYLTFFPEGQEMLRAVNNSNVLAGQLPKSAWDKFFTMTYLDKGLTAASVGGLSISRNTKKDTVERYTLEEIEAEERRRAGK